MSLSLKKDDLISLYLSRVIPICELREKIIIDKNKLEDKETLAYHTDRWDTIAGSHYMAHDTHMGKFSIIFNSEHFVVKPDHRLDFYNLTGISYQIVELIHELIKLKNKTNPWTNTTDKELLIQDDALYSQLATLIMKEMKLQTSFD